MFRRVRGEEGQMLVAAVLAMLVLAILLPVIISMGGRESVWTAKQTKTTKAFHAAEAGADRALWKLRENTTYLDTILTGGSLAGYNNDTVYTDGQGNSYRVKISSDASSTNSAMVTSTGKDAAGKEYRAIEVILKKSSVDAAFVAPSVGITGSVRVFWGPLMAYTTAIDLQGSANQLFPRKMAQAAITASGGSYASRDSNPSAPNTDNLEWWSYDSYPVPDMPKVDLAYYKSQAQSQGLYYTSPPTNRTIPSLVDTDETKVRYFENCNVKFTGSKHFRGILIVDGGNLEFEGSGKEPEGLYVTTPTASAWVEFQKNCPNGGDTCSGTDTSGGGGFGASDDGNYQNNNNAEGDKTCWHQYPGDAGYHTVEAYSIKQGCVAHSQSGGGGGESPGFKGFVYVRGEISTNGSAVIHGAIVVDEGGSWGGGSFQIFYDHALNVKLLGGSFTQTSWRETTPVTF